MANNITSEQFLEKLREGISVKGDFPVSAITINKLHDAILTPNTSNMILSEIILSDPALSIKILNFVNSAFFRRTVEIQSISQAIMHLGEKQLIDLCSSFTLLRSFSGVAKKGGSFANAMERVIVTTIFFNNLNSQESEKENLLLKKKDSHETHLLQGIFAEIGIMLTSFYFPKLYENANQRAKDKKISIDQSINELTGLSPLEISIEVLISLNIPQVYINNVKSTLSVQNDIKKIEKDYQSIEDKSDKEIKINDILEHTNNSIKNLLISLDLSSLLLDDNNDKTLDIIIDEVSTKYKLDNDILRKNLEVLESDIINFYKTLQFNPPIIKKLLKNNDINNNNLENQNAKNNDSNSAKTVNSKEEFSQNDDKIIKNFNSESSTKEMNEENKIEYDDNKIDPNSLLAKYIKNIREAICNNQVNSSASILTTILEAYVWGLDFDRVVLLLIDEKKNSLHSRMTLGEPIPDEQKLTVSILENSLNTISKCYCLGKLCYGNAILRDEEQGIAIPVGLTDNCIGVIYASYFHESKKSISSKDINVSNFFMEMLGSIIVKESKII